MSAVKSYAAESLSEIMGIAQHAGGYELWESWQNIDMEASCIGLKNEGGMMRYKEEADSFLKKLALKMG